MIQKINGKCKKCNRASMIQIQPSNKAYEMRILKIISQCSFNWNKHGSNITLATENICWSLHGREPIISRSTFDYLVIDHCSINFPIKAFFPKRSAFRLGDGILIIIFRISTRTKHSLSIQVVSLASISMSLGFKTMQLSSVLVPPIVVAIVIAIASWADGTNLSSACLLHSERFMAASTNPCCPLELLYPSLK